MRQAQHISSICEHWREPRNAAWRPQAQFFNSLLKNLNHEAYEGHEEKRNEVFIFIDIFDFNHTTRGERDSPRTQGARRLKRA
jgi:hypothetical protein